MIDISEMHEIKREREELLKLVQLLQRKGAIYEIDYVELYKFMNDFLECSFNNIFLDFVKKENKIYELQEKIDELQSELKREKEHAIKNAEINNNIIDTLSKKILKMQNLIKDLYTEAGL